MTKVRDHIAEAIAAKRTDFSFEILPPLKGQNINTIFDNIDPLMEFKPPFIDVTYHREEYIYKERGYLCCDTKPLSSRCSTARAMRRFF